VLRSDISRVQTRIRRGLWWVEAFYRELGEGGRSPDRGDGFAPRLGVDRIAMRIDGEYKTVVWEGKGFVLQSGRRTLFGFLQIAQRY
jgi:hypothetical protein